MKRVSLVGSIKVNGMLFSSILQIGDNAVIQAKTRIFAVQREVAQFWGREGNFEMYPIFKRPSPEPPAIDTVTMSVDNLGSFIQVRHVRILALSTSAVLQVGSNKMIEADTRIKNIRQFVTPRPSGGSEAEEESELAAESSGEEV
jgi:spore germination protein PE